MNILLQPTQEKGKEWIEVVKEGVGSVRNKTAVEVVGLLTATQSTLSNFTNKALESSTFKQSVLSYVLKKHKKRHSKSI